MLSLIPYYLAKLVLKTVLSAHNFVELPKQQFLHCRETDDWKLAAT